jgi:hypothetical protein
MNVNWLAGAEGDFNCGIFSRIRYNSSKPAKVAALKCRWILAARLGTAAHHEQPAPHPLPEDLG